MSFDALVGRVVPAAAAAPRPAVASPPARDVAAAPPAARTVAGLKQ
jgi:hypothetical protein